MAEYSYQAYQQMATQQGAQNTNQGPRVSFFQLKMMETRLLLDSLIHHLNNLTLLQFMIYLIEVFIEKLIALEMQ